MTTRLWWGLGLVALVGSLAGIGCATGDVGGSNDDEGDAGVMVDRADAGSDGNPVIVPVDGGMGADNDASPPPSTTSDAAPVANDSGEPALAPAPILNDIAPKKGIVGSPGPLLVLTGASFVPVTVVQVDGATLPTTYVSATELRATLPTAKLAAAGALHISVGTSPPGGGASADMVFSVEYAAPTMASVAPTSAVMGSPDTTLAVVGHDFATGAKVTFGGANLVTTFVDATSVTAVVPAAKLTTSGSFDVAVVNPSPGGGVSTPIAFTVTNPTVTVSSMAPSTGFIGSGATPIVLVGAGFIPASAVSFNGVGIASAYVDGSHLNATVPTTSLTATGSFPVVITNPAPGGGVSTPVVFQVSYPSPTASGIAPPSALAGSATAQVTLTGSGFFPASQVTFDNVPASTTLVDATHVRAALGASQLANAGTVSVRVVNPTPGGGVSAPLTFTVNNPLAAITALAPWSTLIGSPDTTVTLSGSGFVGTSVVRLNGATNLVTTFVGPTQLTATLPAAQLVSAGVLGLQVINPAPGGGTSNTVSFSVTCDSNGVDVPLGAVGTTWMATLKFASAPIATRFSASGTCPAALSTITEPYRAVVVQNTLATPVTLSAWAGCTADASHDDDAFLTLYRRGSVPVSDADRQACLGVVSEGLNGGTASPFTSPAANGSLYCPGLTKANGGGIALASCERAVVFIAAFSQMSLRYPPPATMYIRPE